MRVGNINRKVSSNEELQTEAAEQTEEIQDVATERYLVENPLTRIRNMPNLLQRKTDISCHAPFYRSITNEC